MPEQSQYDFKQARPHQLHQLLEFPQWRTLKAEIILPADRQPDDRRIG